MHLRIPPPVIGLAGGAAIWFAAKAAPALIVSFPGRVIVAGVLVAIAVLIEGGGVWRFIRHKTTVNPLKPDRASSLVVTGVYRFSRNPMYLGLVCLLAAWGVYLGALIATLIVVAAVVWYLTEFQIKPEEAALEKRFGDPYHAYKQKVRRWL
ncbi:MAG: isoprenylcysteine carboxylmethyltransferase family protein [Roseibium sp.]|nr:isoprenylcysteine carboxylmethyltransferase family protein [Roseibium sp.]